MNERKTYVTSQSRRSNIAGTWRKSLLALLLAGMTLLSSCGSDGGSSGAETGGAGTESAAGAGTENGGADTAQDDTADSSQGASTDWDAILAENSVIPTSKIEGSSLYVRQVANLPDDFILGVDASSVIAEENSGVKYYNFDGEEQDVFRTLAENGVTHIRVRVWNDPYDENGNGFGGGNNDIDTCIAIGKRATQVGMSLIVDFHLSDFWADPSKQMVPRAWEGLTAKEKKDAAYEYVKECLTKLRDAGVAVGMVQIGNEINGKMAGESNWYNIQFMLQGGSSAVREIYPDALVALHFANPEKVTNYEDYAKNLAYYEVDYDVFASSYYPYWHGTLENLASVLSNVAEQYGKKVMVMETSYAYTAEDTDFFGNTIGDGTSGIIKSYPYTVQGQANSFRNIVDTIANDTTNGIGVVYWEGTWISVGTNSYEENYEKWEQYGSGWASSYSAGYDPDDAGKYYGGCAVDNQAFFDAEGKPLESLRIFNLLRYGNETTPVVDALEETNLTVDLNGTIELPETVNAVMTDDSKQPIPVEWEVAEDDLARMYAGGAAKYVITGTADGREAICNLSMVELNYLANDSFEDGDLTAWTLTDLAGADELYVEQKPTDSLTGEYHMHFWSAAAGSVEFTLEQEVQDLASGTYKYSISIMGGDAGDTDIYAYVKLDGETVATAPMQITSYGEWDTAWIRDIAYTAGQELTVGIYVKCSGSGNGAWGKIDDAMLNSMS